MPVSNRGIKTGSAVSVGTTATLLLAANTGRHAALIHNAGSSTLYVGPTNGVTTVNGLPVAAGATLEDERSSDAWYGIVASGTVDVRVVEVA